MYRGWLNLALTIMLILAGFLSEDGFAEKRSVQSTINTIAKLTAQASAVIGVTAILIEKNEKISFKGDLPFAMASTVKLPIAITLLNHVDSSSNSLNTVIHLQKKNLVPGSGKLYQYFHNNVLKISLSHLLRHMMIRSDNTATDAVLKEIKGPKAVHARLKSFGFTHINVNRTIMQLFMATKDVSHMSTKKPWALRKWELIFNKMSLGKRTTAWQIFQNDLRDTATADDMAKLLTDLYQNKLASREKTQYLLSLMEKCETGKNRIKGMLPKNTKVAHKTGTWSIYSKSFLRHKGAKNLYRFAGDVGIITLPQNKGHIALAIYVKSTAVDNESREKLIAQVARIIFDFFNKTE